MTAYMRIDTDGAWYSFVLPWYCHRCKNNILPGLNDLLEAWTMLYGSLGYINSDVNFYGINNNLTSRTLVISESLTAHQELDCCCWVNTTERLFIVRFSGCELSCDNSRCCQRPFQKNKTKQQKITLLCISSCWFGFKQEMCTYGQLVFSVINI